MHRRKFTQSKERDAYQGMGNIQNTRQTGPEKKFPPADSTQNNKCVEQKRALKTPKENEQVT